MGKRLSDGSLIVIVIVSVKFLALLKSEQKLRADMLKATQEKMKSSKTSGNIFPFALEDCNGVEIP